MGRMKDMHACREAGVHLRATRHCADECSEPEHSEVTCRWNGVEIRNVYEIGERGLRVGQFVVSVHDVVARRFMYDNLEANESAQMEAASEYGETLAELLQTSEYVR